MDNAALQTAIQQRRQGWSYEAMARAHGAISTRELQRQVIAAIGMTGRADTIRNANQREVALRLRGQGISWAKIAARLGTSIRGITAIAGHNTRCWRMERAAELRATALTWEQIARRVGYASADGAQTSVTIWCNRQGLPHPFIRPKPVKPPQQRIQCACGCAQSRWLLSPQGVVRRFINGHQQLAQDHPWRSNLDLRRRSA